MGGSYCCNLCGDLTPTRLAFSSHLNVWHNKRAEQGINEQKDSGESKVRTKHASKAKVNRGGTISRKNKDQLKKRGEAIDKNAEKNQVASDETSETLKFSTSRRITYGTRARSKLGQGNSAPVQTSELVSKSTSVARKHQLPANNCFVKIMKLTEDEFTPVVKKGRILVENVVNKVTNKLPIKAPSFTVTKKNNARISTNRFLTKNKNSLANDAANQDDNMIIRIPIQASNKYGMLKATKTAQNFDEHEIPDDGSDEIEMNNEADDEHTRPDSPIYQFPNAKSPKSVWSIEEEQVRKMPQLTPEVPLVLINTSIQPVGVNTGQNVRKVRPDVLNSEHVIPSSSKSTFMAARPDPPRKSIAGKMPTFPKSTTTDPIKTQKQARVYTNTLQCPSCPRQCKSGFILHRHFLQKHGDDMRSIPNGELDAGKVTGPHSINSTTTQIPPIQLPPHSPGDANSEKTTVPTSIEEELEELLSSQSELSDDMDNDDHVEDNVLPKTTNNADPIATTIATTQDRTPASSPCDSDKTLPTSPSFKCDNCGVFLHTAKGLSLHISLAHPIKIETDILQESRPESRRSLTHDAGTPSTEIGSASSSTATSAVELKISISQGRYHCSTCIEEFAFLHERTEHDATHGLGFACLGCGGSFELKTNLDKHFEKAHPELSMGKCTWVKCKHCAIWKSSPSEIKEHMRQAHPLRVQEIEDIVRVKKEFNITESLWPVIDLE